MQFSFARLASVVCVSALAPSSSAQQVVFQDGFENGTTNWTTGGLWHRVDASGCASVAAPFAEGAHAMWYGVDAQCDYDTPGQSNAGSLALSAPILLPDSPSITLDFSMWSHTEYCSTVGQTSPSHVRDEQIVIVQTSTSGVATYLCPWNPGDFAQTAIPWHERRVDLSFARGREVSISFVFDTRDAAANALPGWFVDDVRIVSEPGSFACPSSGFAHGCPCTPAHISLAGGCRNSTGASGTLYSEGSVGVAGDTLRLRAENLPPDAPAILAQSTANVGPVVFGDGLRCAGGQVRRLGATTATNGVATWPAPGAPAISTSGLVPAGGGTRYYSVHYRDVMPFCTPASFNLTNAQRILWVP